MYLSRERWQGFRHHITPVYLWWMFVACFYMFSVHSDVFFFQITVLRLSAIVDIYHYFLFPCDLVFSLFSCGSNFFFFRSFHHYIFWHNFFFPLSHDWQFQFEFFCILPQQFSALTFHLSLFSLANNGLPSRFWLAVTHVLILTCLRLHPCLLLLGLTSYSSFSVSPYPFLSFPFLLTSSFVADFFSFSHSPSSHFFPSVPRMKW